MTVITTIRKVTIDLENKAKQIAKDLSISYVTRVVPVEFPGKGYPVCQYVQVGLFFLALRTAVPDDDVLVVRQPHALHEVVTKFRQIGRAHV